MCFYLEEIESADKAKELTFDEMQKISESTGRLIQLSIAGGEPTLRKDLSEICEMFAINNGVRFITLPTNGINTDQIVSCVASIIKKCPNTHLRVSLSLDGHEALHDQIRNVPGNYRKLIETHRQLKPLAEANDHLTLDFATVLQKDNQDTIQNLFHTVHDEFKPDNHMLMLARGNVQDESVKEVNSKLYRETIELREKLYKNTESRLFSPFIRAITQRSLDLIFNEFLYKKHQFDCVAGKRLIVISERGEVKPCEILNDSLGNLRDYDYDMRKLMKTKKVKDVQKWIRCTKCHCTFECATNISVLYDLKGYPDLIKRTILSSFKSRLN